MLMNEERLRKLGIEKLKTLDNNFDELYEKYKQKAKEQDCNGELRFIKSKGRVTIFVVL